MAELDCQCPPELFGLGVSAPFSIWRHHFWQISYGFSPYMFTPAQPRIPWYTQTHFCSLFSMHSLLSSALIWNSRCFNCPRLRPLFLYLSRIAELRVDPSTWRYSWETLPWKRAKVIIRSPHEFSFSRHQHIVLYVDQSRKRVTSYLLSSLVIVYCRRTGLLPVISRIGSPPLKHSFLTYVHF